MKRALSSWPTWVGVLLMVLARVPSPQYGDVLQIPLSCLGLLFLFYGLRQALTEYAEKVRAVEAHLPVLFLVYHVAKTWANDLDGPLFYAISSVYVLLLPVLSTLTVAWFVIRWREIRPMKKGKPHRFFTAIALLFALLGFFAGSVTLLIPAVIPVVWDWIRRPAVQARLKYYTPLLILTAVFLIVGHINPGLEESSQGGASLVNDIGNNTESLLGQAPLHTLNALSECWLFLVTWLSVLVLIGSLVRHAGIRTKLTANAMLSSLLPMGVLLGVATTIAILMMGAYRARLVLMQSEQQLEQHQLVTNWFAEAMENPLDQDARRRFERQLGSLTIGVLPQAFFSLYLPDGDAAKEDSLDHWRHLTSTWQRPSDFEMQEISLPCNRDTLDRDGLMVINQHLYSVSLVERSGLLAVGYFLRSQENLEEVGGELAAALRIDEIADGDLPKYALYRMGFAKQPARTQLVATPDYPEHTRSLLQRLRVAGMTRLDNDNFVLDDPHTALVATVQSFPQQMMRNVLFQNEIIGASCYAAHVRRTDACVTAFAGRHLGGLAAQPPD